MALIKWEKDGTVAILTMDNGENRQNPVWSGEMLIAFNEIVTDESVKSLVISSSDEKNWSQGVDLQWVLGLIANKDMESLSKWLYQQNEVFRFCLMAPFPTIAAINGHAFGNGALMAGACDFRFMNADRGFFCLPEVDLNIQFTPSMIQWMKKAMPNYLHVEMQLTGRRFSAVELEKHNVILKACSSAEETLKEAVKFAATFSKSRKTITEMKKRAYINIINAMENEDPKYIDPPTFMITA